MAGVSSDKSIDPRSAWCVGLDQVVAVLVAWRAAAGIAWKDLDIGEIVRGLAAGRLEMPADTSGGSEIRVSQVKLMVVEACQILEALCAEAPRLEVPRYEEGKRILWWQGVQVKHWDREAPRQEVVLVACQTAGWADFIANPFLKTEGPMAGGVLIGALKNLNRALKDGPIHFYPNGGRGITFTVKN